MKKRKKRSCKIYTKLGETDLQRSKMRWGINIVRIFTNKLIKITHI